MLSFRKFLDIEANSLLIRLQMIKPFNLTIPTVVAASVSETALREMTNLLLMSNRELKKRVFHFKKRLFHDTMLTAQDAQAHYSILKLRFNALLDSLDIFADVLTQRVEHETGVWVAGLDMLAEDALNISGNYYETPPLVCFLERGHGAAIRRARTRLPGGKLNPVAIIQVPRERMVSSGIASSLIHEVGHQSAALLGLVDSLRKSFKIKKERSRQERAWTLYAKWISEIIADFWAMAHIGIGATMGLINVVSLPRYFMFRVKTQDPHPFPWIRVMLSINFGKALFPHPQWQQLQSLWLAMYPLEKIDSGSRQIIEELMQTMPAFISEVVHHHNALTRGTRLRDMLPVSTRQPYLLRDFYQSWQSKPETMNQASPTLLFAVIGQARADGAITAKKESDVLASFLTQWALMRSEKRSFKQNAAIVQQIQDVIN